jgi:ComF family protein
LRFEIVTHTLVHLDYITTMNYLRKVWNIVLDIFFPPLCLGCRQYLNDAEKPNLLCEKCFTNIDIYAVPFRISPDFTLSAAGSYDNEALRALIHYFKYKGFLAAKKPLSEIMIKHLELARTVPDDALVIPIPLHRKRLRKRGFNQSALIAMDIARHFNIVLRTDLLERVRNTTPQMEIKDYDKRRKNVRKSFEVPAEMAGALTGKTILLIDDVYTSGATIQEAARALRRAGAAKVIGVVLAKTGSL